MLHPLFKTLATQPQRLIEHASAYVELAGVETREALTHWRLRLMVVVGIGLSLLLALALTGAALLVLAALAWDKLAYPWLLVATPAVPMVAAMAGILWLHSEAVLRPYALLREQWQLDRRLLDEREERA